MSMTTPATPHPVTPQPFATLLRQRAAELRRLAGDIERSPVMRLLDAADDAADVGWVGSRPALCERMLAGDLHRLHQAAEHLRQTAFRFAARAEQLDAAGALRGVA